MSNPVGLDGIEFIELAQHSRVIWFLYSPHWGWSTPSRRKGEISNFTSRTRCVLC